MPRFYKFVFTATSLLLLLFTDIATAQIPSQAALSQELSGETVQVFVDQNTIWLTPTKKGLENKNIILPRLCSPIRSVSWESKAATLESKSRIEVKPELRTWTINFDSQPSDDAVIRMELDAPPLLLEDLPPVKPAADGSILLQAYQATATGEKLRFEPQWFKNTVGYWTVQDDYVTWNFEVDQPGTYSVAVLQGCGTGQGGSEAKLTVLCKASTAAELDFKILETGHFQNFRWQDLGAVHLTESGKHQLRIAPIKIAKAAMGDIRMVHLVRQATAQ